MSYDPKCEELAEHFLAAGTSRLIAQQLAQRIQDCIEDEMESLIEEAEKQKGKKANAPIL